MKKVAMRPKPEMKAPTTPDEWVSGGASLEVDDLVVEGASEGSASNTVSSTKAEEEVRLKRLTLDIPENLHARIKSQCALRGVKMVDAIRKILDDAFAE